MIDDRELKELARLHPRNRKPACILEGDKALVHSQWFVLELPKDEIDVTTEWPGKPLEFVRKWKDDQLPEGDGEVAQPMRATWDDEVDDDDEPCAVVQLMSENLQGFLAPELYDFIRRHVEKAEFRLYAGERSDGAPQNVGVFSQKKPVGVITQIVKRTDLEEHGWKTSL